jgi:hypothetical protein
MHDETREPRSGSRALLGLALVALLGSQGCVAVCKIDGSEVSRSGYFPITAPNFTSIVESYWTNSCWGSALSLTSSDFGRLYELYLEDDWGAQYWNRSRVFNRIEMQCKSPDFNPAAHLHDWPPRPDGYDAGWTQANHDWCFWTKGMEPQWADNNLQFVTRDALGNWRLEDARSPQVQPPPCGGYGQNCCGTGTCNGGLACMFPTTSGGPSEFLCIGAVGCKCGTFSPHGSGGPCLNTPDCLNTLLCCHDLTPPLGTCKANC